MKNNRIVFITAFIIVFIGMMVFTAMNMSAQNNEDIMVLRDIQPSMMGSFNRPSYEFIYFHLSSDDQETLDITFATEIKDSDMDEKSIPEVIEIIEGIKETLLNDFEFEYRTYRHGMMSFGGSNQTYACRGYVQSNSYEWIYIHASTNERAQLDQAFAEEIMNMNRADLTIEEIVDQINVIKTNLVDAFLSQFE